ncbi:unnamed protein product [Closterium sp. NIES-65]|nr:unnamed protein product [Closterium sp. NIES-65]
MLGAGTSTPTALTRNVPLTKLVRGPGLTTALLLLARTTTRPTPLRRVASSSTAAAAASATSATSAPSATTAASSASTAATAAATPATTPTTTPTPSTASTATSTAPASPSSSLAPLALAVAENDLAFNVSKSKSIQAFVDAVIVYAKPYTLPTPYKVSSPLLEKLKAGSEDLVRPLTDSSKTSGCTLSIDGWTCIESCGLVCVIALNDTAPVIIDIVDSKTAKKTRDYLAGLIEGAIKTVGPKHVVQVVMDNASKNKNAANKLRLEYPHIFFTNCAAHCLDLMLHDIGKIPAIKHVLALVHSVVMMIKGSASAVVLFRELFTKLSLVRLGATRFGTQVIMLGRFLEVKRALRVIVISDRGEGRLGSHNARWAATTLVEAGRMMDAEWWFLFGRDVQAPPRLGCDVTLTASHLLRGGALWSALARVQSRGDRNCLTAQKMTDVTFVAFTPAGL